MLGYSYRLTNLLPFFLLGAILMRHGFRRDRYLWAMAIIAPLAYAVRPVVTAVFDTPGHVSGSYIDTLHDVGLVFAVYVVIVLLATVRRPGAARVIADGVRAAARDRCGGAEPVRVARGAHRAVDAHGYQRHRKRLVRWLVIVPGMVVAGWLWWRFIGVGPVEWLLGWVTGRPKRWRRTKQNAEA